MKIIIVLLLIFGCSKKIPTRKIASADVPRKFFSIKPENEENLKRIDWKLLFNEILTKHIVQDPLNSPVSYSKYLKVKESVLYGHGSFENVFNSIAQAKTSVGVYENRQKVLSNKKVLKKLMKGKITDQDFKTAESFIKLLNNQFKKDTGPIENYFNTELGKKVIEYLKDTVLILIPGFGSHTMSEMIMPELMDELNEYYGRNSSRPHIKTLFDVKYQDYRVYYKKPKIDHKFDIVQPLGYEMGITTSIHDVNIRELKTWIDNLPEHYSEKKLIFLGYSKGATIASTLVTEYSDIRDRTRGIFSVGGAIQGSNVAEGILRKIYDIDPNIDPDEFKKLIEKIPKTLSVDELATKLTEGYFKDNFLLQFLAKNIKNLPPTYKKALQALVNQVSGGELKDFLPGMYEQGQYFMLKWNLEKLNEKYFDRPLALFNLSFLADRRRFIQRGPVSEMGAKIPPEIIPQVMVDGINTSRFSLDLVIGSISSINMFEQSILGLTDTQVAWNDSKYPLVDHLPLKATFHDDELKRVYEMNSLQTFLKQSKISFEDFKSQPRKEIFKKRGVKDMHFVDLGEVSGTHWSPMFRQVLRLPGVPEFSSHIHTFPHKSLFKSILETYTIYELLRNGDLNEK